MSEIDIDAIVAEVTLDKALARVDRFIAVGRSGWSDPSLLASLMKVREAAALAHAAPEGLPDELGVGNWPGGGGRVSKYDDATWVNDGGGAWVLLYAPRQFYDGLRRLSQPDATDEAVSLPTIEQKYRLREVLLTHTFILVFRDEVGDLGRCSCGEQGFDFKDGREWYANHVLALFRGELDMVQNRST